MKFLIRIISNLLHRFIVTLLIDMWMIFRLV